MKKIILIIIVVFLVFTFNYKNKRVKSVLNIRPFNNEYVSFDEWIPGEVKPINYTVSNNEIFSVMVRVKIKSKWVNYSGNKIIDVPKDIVIIDVNSDDWKYYDGYYYYKYSLNSGEESSLLINSIMLNEKYFNVTCTSSDDGLVRNCSSNMNMFDNKKYVLSFKQEIIDKNMYSKVWN